MTLPVNPHNALRTLLLTGCFAALLVHGSSMAQNRNPEAPLTPLAEAQAALERRDWASAEALLEPLIKVEPKNPFAYFELAQLYENTNRVEAARNIYQAIAAIPEAEKANYVVIAVRDNKRYMVLLPNLAQEKLATLVSSAAPVPPPAAPVPPPAAPVVAASPVVPSSSAVENEPPVMAMRQWLAAWQSKQMNPYFASYVPGYKGDMATAAAWQKSRFERIATKTKINIQAYNVSINQLDAQQVQVKFTQSYVSPTLTNLATKTLVMVNSNGRWLISKESVK